MSLSSVQLAIIALFVITIVAILFVRLVLIPRMRRHRTSMTEGDSWVEDRAWNQIQAARGLADFLERSGTDVREARLKIEQALGKHEMRRFSEARRLAQEASESLATQQKKKKASESASQTETAEAITPSPEKGAPTHRDLSPPSGAPGPAPSAAPPSSTSSTRTPGSKASRLVAPSKGTTQSAEQGAIVLGEDEEGPPPPSGGEDGSEEPTLAAEKARHPKDYMESRFMLSSLKNDLDASPPERRSDAAYRESKDWAQKAQAAFDRRDYTECLRLAMRGRRRLGGAGISTISVGAGTVVEAPPEEASPTALRSSGPPTTPVIAGSGPMPSSADKVTCGRCGRQNLPTDRFCRGCGSPLAPPACPRCKRPVEPDDKFCAACGAPLGSAS